MRYFEVCYSDGARYLHEIPQKEAYEEFTGPKLAMTDIEGQVYDAFVKLEGAFQAHWREVENAWYNAKKESKE